ncbi:MAG: PEP-CTERM sorting domain-containing protein, partial [Rubrivivax sp.]
SFTLIDLDPFDGLTPTVNFTTGNGSTALSISAADTAIGEAESAGRTRPGTFSFSKEFLAELTNASAQASISQNALSAQGYANGAGTSFSAAASTGNPSGNYNNVLSISLSANAALLVNADLSLSAAASNGTCSYYYYYCSSYYSNLDQATATGSLSLSYSYSADGAYVSYNRNDTQSLTATSTGAYQTYNYQYNPNTGYYEYVYFTVPGTSDARSLTQVLKGTFTNMSNSTQYASLGLSVGVSGQATSAAVPEAGTLGMAAAGLIVAGALAGRTPVATAVPEAGSSLMALAGLGIVGGLLRRRRA